MTDTQARCGSCKHPIRWVTTEKGKPMPLDWHPTEHGNVVPRDIGGLGIRAHVLGKDEEPVEGEPRYTTHWETCPNAKQHRKGKR